MSELDQLLQTASEQITATDNLKILDDIRVPVSYTHLTLPTNREV